MLHFLIVVFIIALIVMVGKELLEGAIYIGIFLALFYYGFKLLN